MKPLTRNLVIIAAVVAVAIVAAILYSRRDAEVKPLPSNPVIDESVSAKRTVTDFGSKLKNVSLLAEDAAAQIEREYKSHVTFELLSEWKSDPASAPGRRTSSPWPERIDVSAIDANGVGSYRIQGSVIETVQGDSELVETGAQRIAVTVAKYGETWLIADYETIDSAAPADVPKEVTMSGIDVCLPHRNTSGPQTMECAFGLKTDDGSHYALDLSGLPGGAMDANLGGQQRLTITGLLVPIEQISTDLWQKYDIKGIIKVNKLERS